jgi:hypothetical protein
MLTILDFTSHMGFLPEDSNVSLITTKNDTSVPGAVFLDRYSFYLKYFEIDNGESLPDISIYSIDYKNCDKNKCLTLSNQIKPDVLLYDKFCDICVEAKVKLQVDFMSSIENRIGKIVKVDYLIINGEEIRLDDFIFKDILEKYKIIYFISSTETTEEFMNPYVIDEIKRRILLLHINKHLGENYNKRRIAEIIKQMRELQNELESLI